MTDLTETQTVARLVDNAKNAADCAAQMCLALRFNVPVSPKLLIRFRSALRQSSGCAHHLAHMQQNPQFLALRDAMDQTSSLATKISMGNGAMAGAVLAHIGTVLDRLWQQAERMATAKPVARADVLAMLDVRKMGQA